MSLLAASPGSALAAAGALDPSFGTGGTVTTPIGTNDAAWATVVQGDGKIVAAGQCSIASAQVFCVARYNGDGSLDSSFGTGGTVSTAISTSDLAHGWATELDGP